MLRFMPGIICPIGAICAEEIAEEVMPDDETIPIPAAIPAGAIPPLHGITGAQAMGGIMLGTMGRAIMPPAAAAICAFIMPPFDAAPITAPLEKAGSIPMLIDPPGHIPPPTGSKRGSTPSVPRKRRLMKAWAAAAILAARTSSRSPPSGTLRPSSSERAMAFPTRRVPLPRESCSRAVSGAP